MPRTDRPSLFSGLEELVESGQLVFPKQVIEELNWGPKSPKWQGDSEDFLMKWAKKQESRACRFGPLFDVVAEVLAEVPDVLDHDKCASRDEADPYVLAIAKHLQDEGEQVTVVNEERKDRPDKMSLTTACGILRLVCLPMKAFLGRERIWRPV